MLTAFLIDGFNFYHSIKPLPRRLRWFDYPKYCNHFLCKGDTVHSISYFTALAHWRTNSVARHRVFVEACKIQGVTVVEGKFKEKHSPCPHCKKDITRHEEKATDVNIALHAYRIAKSVEQLFLITGDTDLIPAVRLIKQDYPNVRVGVIFPFNRANKELKTEAHLSRKTTRSILGNFILPDRLTKGDGTVIYCPQDWK